MAFPSRFGKAHGTAVIPHLLSSRCRKCRQAQPEGKHKLGQKTLKVRLKRGVSAPAGGGSAFSFPQTGSESF